MRNKIIISMTIGFVIGILLILFVGVVVGMDWGKGKWQEIGRGNDLWIQCIDRGKSVLIAKGSGVGFGRGNEIVIMKNEKEKMKKGIWIRGKCILLVRENEEGEGG